MLYFGAALDKPLLINQTHDYIPYKSIDVNNFKHLKNVYFETTQLNP